MWTYANTCSCDELYHYGVLGMKWGRRKNRHIGSVGRATIAGVANMHKAVGGIQKRSSASIQKNADSMQKQKSKMLSLKNKNGEPLFTEEDVDNMISGLNAKARKKNSKANAHEKFAKNVAF